MVHSSSGSYQGLRITLGVVDFLFYMIQWQVGTALLWFTPRLLTIEKLIRGKKELFTQLKSFTVENAKVFDETDRKYVYDHIEDWFQGSLGEFDRKVREDFLEVTKRSLGSSWQTMPWSDLVFANSPLFYMLMYDGVLTCLDLNGAMRAIVLSIGMCLVWDPLYMSCTGVLVERILKADCGTCIGVLIRVSYVIVTAFLWPLWLWFSLRFPLYASVPVLLAGVFVLVGLRRKDLFRVSIFLEKPMADTKRKKPGA